MPGFPDWSQHPQDVWAEEGFRLLDKLGKHPTNYSNKVMKDRVLESVTFAYWRALVTCAGRLTPSICEGDELVEQALGRRLGVNRSTTSRWMSGKTAPDGDKVFGGLLFAVKKEIHEVGFPRNREVAWQAVSRTFAIICDEDLNRGRRPIGREEFACVWWLARHPTGGHYLESGDAAVQAEVHRSVFAEVRRYFPGLTSSAYVPAAVREWLIPYLLFLVGLPPMWEALDDAAIARP